MTRDVPAEVAVGEIRVGLTRLVRGESERHDSPRTPPTPETLADLLDPESTSSVVRVALDEMLLEVIGQVKRDLATGNPKTRQQIAKTFLPSIINMASKDGKDADTELQELRAQMDDLHKQMFNAPPTQYEPATTHVPDEDDLPEGRLPSVDITTGAIVDATHTHE